MKRCVIILIALYVLSLFTSAAAGQKPAEIMKSTVAQSDNYENYFSSLTAKRARQNWMLNCQGCHKPDGSGRPDKGLPDLRGTVSQFLTVEGGREYLARVPGITNAMTSDEALAELLDWTLIKFDPANIPSNHKLFTAEEIQDFRKKPYATEALPTRDQLLKEINQNKGE